MDRRKLRRLLASSSFAALLVAAQSARAFARNLIAKRDVPLLLWDERLSTAAVTRTLLEGDASRKRRGEVVDKMAAAYMLQGALDAMQERRA